MVDLPLLLQGYRLLRIDSLRSSFPFPLILSSGIFLYDPKSKMLRKKGRGKEKEGEDESESDVEDESESDYEEKEQGQDVECLFCPFSDANYPAIMQHMLYCDQVPYQPDLDVSCPPPEYVPEYAPLPK